MTDADDADDKYTCPGGIPATSSGGGADGIDFHANADNMEYMCFNKSGDISTLKDGSLKLVD